MLEVLAENSEICKLKAKNFADEREREGKALVGIMNFGQADNLFPDSGVDNGL